MLVVVAVLFPVALLLVVLGLELVEHRLQRSLFGTDVQRYLEAHVDTDDAEQAVAADAAALLAAKGHGRKRP